MLITPEIQGQVTILNLGGRLDTAAGLDLKLEIGRLVAAGQVNLVLVMKAIDFIDSSGLGSLVASLRAVTGAGGDIKVAEPSPEVQGVFRLTRLHHLLEVHDSAAAAVESFAAAG